MIDDAEPRHAIDRIRATDHSIGDVDQHLARVLADVAGHRAANARRALAATTELQKETDDA